MTTPAPRPLQIRLQQLVAEDGRSIPSIAAPIEGLSYSTLSKVVHGHLPRPSATKVRLIATALGADVDELLALAGHSERATPIPQPSDVAGMPDALRTLLRATQVARHPSAAAMGRASGGGRSLERFLSGETDSMERPVLARIAAYYGWDPAALEELRPKQLRRGAAIIAARQANARERGSWFRTEQGHQDFVEKRRASGFGARAFATRVERFGFEGAIRGLRMNTPERLQAVRAAAARRRAGTEELCLFCRDPNRPIYRPPWARRRVRRQFHRACWTHWMRRLLHPYAGWGRAHKILHAERVVRIIDAYGTDDQRRRWGTRINAYMASFRRRKAIGRPSTYEAYERVALETARQRDDDGLSPRAIGDRAGRTPKLDPRTYRAVDADRQTKDDLSYGRLLRRVAPRSRRTGSAP